MAEHSPKYTLTNRWTVAGRLEHAAAIFRDVETFPLWWKPVFLKAAIIEHGTANGEGRVATLTTRGFLPYVLRWRILITDSREPFGFDFCAAGDLVGRGHWTLRQAEQHVDIEVHWMVAIQKPVLKQLSPFLKPLLVRNHRWAMACGERGLQAEMRRRSMS